jgi:hypothetical protein
MVESEFFGSNMGRAKNPSCIDHTHPATADLAEDVVMRNRLPHGLCGDTHLPECDGRLA